MSMYFSTQFVVFSLFFLLFSRILYKHCFLAEGRAEPFPFINILWAWADTSKQYSCMNKHTQKCEKKGGRNWFYVCAVQIWVYCNYINICKWQCLQITIYYSIIYTWNICFCFDIYQRFTENVFNFFDFF